VCTHHDTDAAVRVNVLGVGRWAVVVLGSVAWLMAGCGDGDGGASTADDDQRTADEAIAAVEQTLRDDGFSAPADEDDDDDDDDMAWESEECRELEEEFPEGLEATSLPGETASAESEDFERGELTPAGGVMEMVTSSATFVEERDDLDTAFDFLNDERLESCFEEILRVGFGADTGIEIDDVDVERLGSRKDLGDGGGGLQGTAEATSSGVTFPFSISWEVVSVERALVSVTIVAVGPDQPSADRAALLQVLVDALNDPSD
jgi:hypothetical protein